MHNTCHARQYVALAASPCFMNPSYPFRPAISASFRALPQFFSAPGARHEIRRRPTRRTIRCFLLSLSLSLSLSASAAPRDPLTRNSTPLKIIRRVLDRVSLSWQPETPSQISRARYRAREILVLHSVRCTGSLLTCRGCSDSCDRTSSTVQFDLLGVRW